MKEMGSGAVDMPDEERLVMLRELVQKLHLANEKLTKAEREKSDIGKQLFILNSEISKLKGVVKARPNLGALFMDAAFNLLKPDVYELIRKEAAYIYDLRNKGFRYNAIERRQKLQIEKALKNEN